MRTVRGECRCAASSSSGLSLPSARRPRNRPASPKEATRPAAGVARHLSRSTIRRCGGKCAQAREQTRASPAAKRTCWCRLRGRRGASRATARDCSLSRRLGAGSVVLFATGLAVLHVEGHAALAPPATGRKIHRFSLWERWVHWTRRSVSASSPSAGSSCSSARASCCRSSATRCSPWLAIHRQVSAQFHRAAVLRVGASGVFTFVRDNIWRALRHALVPPISAACSPGTTCRRVASMPTRRSGSGAACSCSAS